MTFVNFGDSLKRNISTEQGIESSWIKSFSCTVADPGFPGEGVNGKGGGANILFCPNFPQKLEGWIQELLQEGHQPLWWGHQPNIFYPFSENPHEIKEIFVCTRARSAPPLRSATELHENEKDWTRGGGQASLGHNRRVVPPLPARTNISLILWVFHKIYSVSAPFWRVPLLRHLQPYVFSDGVTE